MSGEVIARLFVAGRPRTKGSLKPIHIRGGKGRPCRVSLTEDHEQAAVWKRAMIQAIGNMRVGKLELAEPYSGPVEVHAFWRFERELETGAKRRSDRQVWPSHDTEWPTAMDIGDEDKLRRNLLDALTQSGLLADDRLVVGGMNYKRWCLPEEKPGVEFVVRVAPEPMTLVALERSILDGVRLGD
jgi:Holliday junction resolvase RusA-like endonuclease